MNNRDYTLSIKDVAPKDQKRISTLFSTLQEFIAAQGLVIAFSSAMSIEQGQWIVELYRSHGWQRSANPMLNMVFPSKEKAEEALDRKLDIYRGVPRSDYRIRRIN